MHLKKQKWKIIDHLTNQSHSSGLQPVKRFENGETVYLFCDDDILHELENHHIRKNESSCNNDCSDPQLLSFIANVSLSAKSCSGSDIMNSEISDTEVIRTFSKGSNTPGPDGISSSLIDKADRELIHLCLKFLWNKAWIQGCFPKLWKQENRVVIPKPGKEDYNECSSYRTISITPCIGKCFEYITSQRLAAVLHSYNFDPYQFAYLRSRSCTQAAMLVTERIKQSLIRGNKAGAIFFDFSDAFGSVNRNRLLYKIANDFGITGKLFLHIQSFLNDRIARIKVSSITGDWIDSTIGTSAGTSLGPLLFIVHIHDVPKSIFPKFADDVVTISVDTDINVITAELQKAADELYQWSRKEFMELNINKTKVMYFGGREHINITINQENVENVTSFKYLGVVLDPELNFSAHVDYTVGKAKRAAAKVSRLIDGRKGIDVRTGIHLYKTLVRPHLGACLGQYQ